jgi:type 1 fimbria pilin
MRAGLLLAMILGTLGAAPAGAGRATITGEVVDVRCHTQSAGNAGAAHADCALSCARRGGILGIATPDGVYVITGEFTASGNRKLIEFVARTVEATGEVTVRDGRRLINLTAISLKAES